MDLLLGGRLFMGKLEILFFLNYSGNHTKVCYLMDFNKTEVRNSLTVEKIHIVDSVFGLLSRDIYR